jgi:hypothetical protein
MMWTMSLVIAAAAVGWHMHFHPPPAAEPGAGSPEGRPAEPGAATARGLTCDS